MKLTFGKLNTKTLATLAKRVINSSKSGNYTLIENHPLLLEIEKEYEIYEKVYSKLVYSGKGEQVAQMDKKRDSLMTGIRLVVRGYSKMTALPIHKEAKELLETISQFGSNITTLSYSDETAQLIKLLEELNIEDNKKKLENLGLTEAIERLKEVQTEFEQLYTEQAEANAELRALPSATTIRKDLEQALKKYFKLLEAMQSVPDWNMIYADINELVKSASN